MDTNTVCLKLAQAMKAEPALYYEYTLDVSRARASMPQNPWPTEPIIRFGLNYGWNDVCFVIAQKVLVHRMRPASRLPQ